MVVFGEESLYSGKSCCNQAKGVVIREKLVVISQKWLYSDKVVVFGQSGCIRSKVVVFGQNGCFRAKVGVFKQK